MYQQILGNNECFEPYTSNIYVRRVLSGEFTVVNQHLLHDLNRLGLWNPAIKNELVGLTRVGAEGAEQTCSVDLDVGPRHQERAGGCDKGGGRGCRADVIR